jgi:trk system potassium uptake protein TrkA
MYVIILGAGRVGLTLTNLLINDGYDVTLIEKNEDLCNDAAAELDAWIICGNGTDTKTLEEANVQDADFFIAATGYDETNLLSSVLVKNYKKPYEIPKVIARVSDPNNQEAFKKVGIDEVISPEITAANLLQKIIINPHVADLTAFGKGDAEILDVIIENEKINEKKISEISPTDDYIIIATYHKDKLIIPKPDTILRKGNKISILVKRDAFKKTAEKFLS